MKKTLKWTSLLVMAIALFAVFVLSVGAETEGYYTYSVSNREATITDVDTAISGDIVIPDTLGRYPVTSIGNYAFEGCRSLTSIEIPSGVTSIGSSAFYYCSSLTSIEIPNGVTSIGSSAFCDCSALQSIEIPSSVTSIGIYAFRDCSSLASVTFAEGSQLTSIGSSAFYYCSSLTSIEIPSSVTSIGNYAFYNYYDSDLESVTFAEGSLLESIGERAFYGCTLQSIEIPSGVTSIGEYAFYNCSALTEINFNATAMNDLSSINYVFAYAGRSGSGITVNIGANVTKIPANLFSPYPYPDSYSSYLPNITSVVFAENSQCESIGARAFQHCSLTSIDIPSTVTSIGDWAFYDCNSLTSIEIPSSVTSIGDEAFYDCNDLENVIFAEGSQLASIGESAFSWCTELQSIEIQSSVTSIGNYAFYYCSSLKSVTFAEGSQLTSIGSSAFYYCSSLTSIEIPSGVTSIGDDAFRCCSSLASVTFVEGSQLTSIGGHAFYNCSALQSIEIPNSVTSIGSSAFSHCSSLTSIIVEEGNSVYHSSGNCLIETASKTLMQGCNTSVIPNDGSVTSIGNYAFYYCGSLTSIEIPSSVTSIGERAFNGCRALQSIVIPSGVTSIGNYAFYNCNDLENVIFAEGSQLASIFEGAFSHCSSLQSIVIPSSVTSIGDDAFSWCTELQSIEIPSSVTIIGSTAFSNCNKLVEVHNLSSLNIEAGSAENGYVGYYALNVYTPTSGASKLHTTSDGYVFYEDGDTVYLVGYSGSDLDLILPSAYNEKHYAIYQYAFYNCNNLSSIKLPSSVTSIGNSAFHGCSSLTGIKISSGVTSIGGATFGGCSALQSIEIPSSVTSIGYYAFGGCYNLANIYYSGSEEEWNAITKGSDWDSDAGRDTEKGTYVLHYNYEKVDVCAYQVTKAENGLFSLRAIAGMNSLAYANFGYEVTITTKDELGNDVEQTLSGSDDKVYSSVYGGETAYSLKEMFGYEYGGLATIADLDIDSTYTKIEIRAYVTTVKGEVKYGKSATILYTGTLDADGYPEFTSVTA